MAASPSGIPPTACTISPTVHLWQTSSNGKPCWRNAPRLTCAARPGKKPPSRKWRPPETGLARFHTIAVQNAAMRLDCSEVIRIIQLHQVQPVIGLLDAGVRKMRRSQTYLMLLVEDI